MVDESVEQGVARLRQMLRRAIQLSGLSNREVERRMGFGRHSGYLSRLFSGSRHLKVHQVLAILKVAGIPPGNFFRGVFPRAEQEGLAHDIEVWLAGMSRNEEEEARGESADND